MIVTNFKTKDLNFKDEEDFVVKDLEFYININSQKENKIEEIKNKEKKTILYKDEAPIEFFSAALSLLNKKTELYNNFETDNLEKDFYFLQIEQIKKEIIKVDLFIKENLDKIKEEKEKEKEEEEKQENFNSEKKIKEKINKLYKLNKNKFSSYQKYILEKNILIKI